MNLSTLSCYPCNVFLLNTSTFRIWNRFLFWNFAVSGLFLFFSGLFVYFCESKFLCSRRLHVKQRTPDVSVFDWFDRARFALVSPAFEMWWSMVCRTVRWNDGIPNGIRKKHKWPTTDGYSFPLSVSFLRVSFINGSKHLLIIRP